jgi:diguanylate cyclase (GGDEF)-like protein/PAS domain S-box-containing protein
MDSSTSQIDSILAMDGLALQGTAPRACAMLDALPMVVLEFGHGGGSWRLTQANEAAANALSLLTGWSLGDALDTVLPASVAAWFVSHCRLSAVVGDTLAPLVHTREDAQGQALAWEFSARCHAVGYWCVMAHEVSAREAMQAAHHEVQVFRETFRCMEELANLGMWRRREVGGSSEIYWSAGLSRLAGVEPQPQLSFGRSISGIVAEDLPAFMAAQGSGENTQVRYRWRKPDGEVRWMLAHMRKPTGTNPLEMEMGLVRDITDEWNLSERLRDRLAFIERIASRVPGYIFQYRLHPDGSLDVPYLSEAVREMVGIDPAAAMKDLSVLLRRVIPEDRGLLRRFSRVSLHEMQPWQCEFRIEMPDGSRRWHMTSVAPHLEADGSILSHGFTTDITDRKQAESEIERLAFYDPLTGLPNRRLLLDRLQRAVAVSLRTRQRGALLFIDLDNFKDLNDTLGHDIGDQLLTQVAQRLVAGVREVDTVARFGGDEFVVMLENLASEPTEAARRVRAVAEKLLEQVNQPIELGGKRHYSSPSIGITLFGDERHSVDELLKQADLAMYEAKAGGRNTLRFFDPTMQANVNARLSLEADMRQGLGRQEFFVHYQPVVDHRARLVGAEVLARWQHPQRGLVSPGEFIGLAEQTGLILPLGHFVLQQACEQLARWSQDPSTQDLYLSVNVSARQFHHPDFVDEVLHLLKRNGVNPRKLTLELTESLLFGDGQDTRARMALLKEHGVCFSLDDFGTGYSSLSYLKRLPLDQIKIDQSFVRDVLSDPNDAAIVRTILALVKSMDLQVVAEGVETTGQLAFLRLHGCDGFQGYLFGRPASLEAWDDLLFAGR